MTTHDRDATPKQRKETTVNTLRVIGILALGVAALLLLIIQSPLGV